jgi:hypothetical protein
MSVNVTCPKCRATLSAGAHLAGQVVACPHCATTLTVQAPPAPRPPANPDDYRERPWYASAFVFFAVVVVAVLIANLLTLVSLRLWQEMTMTAAERAARQRLEKVLQDRP